jgi:hypothetical protein
VAGSLSHTATSSLSGNAAMAPKWTTETVPHPTTATLIVMIWTLATATGPVDRVNDAKAVEPLRCGEPFPKECG